MKYLKNISLFAIAFMTSIQMYSIAPEKNELPSSDTNQAFVLDGVHYNEEFKPYTTDKWIYNQKTTTQKHSEMYTSVFGKHPNGKSITDETSEELLSSRVTRRYTQVITENGVSVTVKETWVSRNPSYVTWLNGALVIGAITGAVLGAAAINAYGNVYGSAIDAGGNVVATALQNPESAAVFGTSFGKSAIESLNNNPEGQKFMKLVNTEIEKRQQANALVAAPALATA